MIKRKAFCEFGAYAVNVLDISKIVVMPLRTAGDLGLPITKTVTIDFTKILNPKSNIEADFDAALVDALGVEKDGSDKDPSPIYPHLDGLNVLTVGPVFPPCPHVGGISYTRDRFYKEVRSVMDPGHDQWPAYGLRTYQIMTTATFDTTNNQLRRYHGFHAIVKGESNGKKQLQIETKLVEVDLVDRSICDDPASVQNEIIDADLGVPQNVLTSASKVDDEGAVFLALPFCAANELRQGKLPPGGGYEAASTASDPFAESVFNLSLSRSRKIDIKPGDLASVREQLIKNIVKMGGGTENLDLIADSPGGLQIFGTQKLNEIFDDDNADQDDRLARLIRYRFARCRLLGCYTALSTQSRKRMLKLAKVLGVPVLGTMRAISWSDFDKYSFRDYQVIGNVRTTILKSTEQMSQTGAFDTDTEEQLASGWYQEMWLRQFKQVPFDVRDVSQDLPRVPSILVSADLFQHQLAVASGLTFTTEAKVVLQAGATAKIPAEVLASATLLRLQSRNHGPVYLNLPPRSPLRQDLLAFLAFSS